MQAQVPGDPYVGLWTRLEPLTKPDATAVTDEGARLLAFLIPGAAAVELREIGEDAQRA